MHTWNSLLVKLFGEPLAAVSVVPLHLQAAAATAVRSMLEGPLLHDVNSPGTGIACVGQGGMRPRLRNGRT